jgi:hypothetical protein
MLSFDRKMRSIRYHIKAIEYDEFLKRNGWEIYYALDYSVIYSHAFATWDFIKRSKVELSEAVKHEIIQKSAGIHFLLDNTKYKNRLILLPPYAYELGDFINKIRCPDFRAEIQLQKLQNFFIKKKADYNAFEKLIEMEKKEVRELPAKLVSECINLLVEEFGDLLFLWLCQREQGLHTIKKLFCNNQIDFIDTLWPNATPCKEKYDESSVLSSDWMKMFREVRNRPQSDFLDAQAINIVLELNSVLNKDKKVLLLVSDAPSMTRVLNWDLIPRNPPSVKTKPRGVLLSLIPDSNFFPTEYRILRTPRTFLGYILFLNGDQINIEQSLNKWENSVDKYFSIAVRVVKDIREKCTHRIDHDHERIIIDSKSKDCEECPISNKSDELLNLINTYGHVIEEFENVQLCLNKKHIFKEASIYNNTNAFSYDLSKMIFDFVETIMISSELVKNEIHQKRRTLEDTINEILHSIPTKTIQAVSKDGLIVLRQLINHYIRFSEILRFSNRKITEIFTKIKNLKPGQANIDTLRSYIYALVELSNQNRNEVYEANLLRAFLAYMYGEYGYCNEVIEDELNYKDLQNEIGLKFLHCLVTYKRGDELGPYLYEKSIKLAEDFLNNNLGDPRAHHLLGLLLLRSMKIEDARFKRTIQEILSIYKNALNLNPTGKLRIAILNNIVYGLTRFGSNIDDSLERAEKYASELEKLENKEDWTPSIIDTIGCLAMLKAKKSFSNEDKKNYYSKALNHFDESIKLAYSMNLPKEEIDPIKKHREEVIEMMGNIK